MPHPYTDRAKANGQCVDGSLGSTCHRSIIILSVGEGDQRRRVARRACTKYTIHTIVARASCTEILLLI
ncbi:hypothetical protein LSTR_LSTR011571 [Laodelphax striatellus]|uniref:Uncharacterized protein n=1 Tax=Laodelphax striatellus TaxID=195883 RepID=A0A482X719_LAOST|nr:hypothetical protein LSTR_LSTR011571 [Laodelphax striatellus]